MSYELPENAINEFYAEAEEIIARATSHLTSLESQGYSEERIDSLYRDIHTLKGSAQLFGFSGVGIIGHTLESSLEPIRRKKVGLSNELVTESLACLDLIDRMLKDPATSKIDGPMVAEIIETVGRVTQVALDLFNANFKYRDYQRPPLDDYQKDLIRFREALKNKRLERNSASKADPAKGNPPDSVVAKSSKPESTEIPPRQEQAEVAETHSAELATIRVQVGLLDRLMNLIGEMVLVRNQVLQYNQKNEDYEFHKLSQKLDLVTSELQEDVMKTRLQPIGTILTKFQRVVRDLARELNKKIELHLKGTETELDRSLLEAIKDPLTHIIRNSCDHGLESPEARIKSGKRETGNIVVNAFQEGGQVIIDITDDGRGLNLPKILQIAIEKKLVPVEKAQLLSDREIALLIFAPGFSTADQVSSLSGRGVGMDVVKTNIEKIGGFVDLSTEPNKGTKIRLRIPLTLAIVPAMMIKTGGENFAIPQIKLHELLLVNQEGDGAQIETLQGHPVLRLRGEILPIVFLNEALKLNWNENKSESLKTHLNVVVLSGEGRPFGVVVDEIRDTADIVVKPLPKFIKNLNLYSGATIMGDGSVSMILDVLGLAEKAHVLAAAHKKEMAGAGLLDKKSSIMSDSQEMLFFDLNVPGQFCLPLALVQRLEEFSAEQMISSGAETIVQYRDTILPIINLNTVLGLGEESETATKQDNQKFPVIVITKRRRLFGIRVNRIHDVINLKSEIEPALQSTHGILGNIINGTHIATVVDALGIIEHQLGEPDGMPETVKAPIRPPFKKGSVRILLAEDSPFFMKQIQRLLESYQCEVVHAPDGDAALKILKSSKPNRFQLVISDIEMPMMTGYELAEEIRADERWKAIPLVALTTRFSEEDYKRGMAVGFTHYLEKINPDELINTIAKEVEGVSA